MQICIEFVYIYKIVRGLERCGYAEIFYCDMSFLNPFRLLYS